MQYMQSMKSISKDDLMNIITKLCKDDLDKEKNIGTLFELRTLEYPDKVHSVILLNCEGEIL